MMVKLNLKVYITGFIIYLAYLSPCNGQNISKSLIPWVELQDGMYFCEIDAPEKSFINDSKLTILKIDPSKYEFNLLTATEHGNISRSAKQWAEEYKLNVVVNAGMYSPTKNRINKGYLKNYEHINNGRLSSYYNGMMALNPKDSLNQSMSIYDFSCESWDNIKTKYYSFCQGMRMIDCSGNSLAWDKKPGQSCSMVIVSTDIEGNIYFIFTRSPYTHQEMIGFLIGLPIDIRTSIYLEGGPETSLFINSGDTTISKIGCYVSKTWERDDNDHFREIPNVIGIRKK